jgi:hypothetical protein
MNMLPDFTAPAFIFTALCNVRFCNRADGSLRKIQSDYRCQLRYAEASSTVTAMYVAKWESSDDNSHVKELAGSPYFTKLYNDVVDEMVNIDSGKSDAIHRWENWRAIEQNPEHLKKTRSRIRDIRAWQTWSIEQKRQMIEKLLGPFKATPATLDELLSL